MFSKDNDIAIKQDHTFQDINSNLSIYLYDEIHTIT